MVFSSSAFLFFFLTITLGLYYAARKSRWLSNLVLTLMSLLFYAWGEPRFALIMLGSIFMNWLIALGLERLKDKKLPGRALLTLGVAMNVSLLAVYKYAGFAVRNVNALFDLHLPDPGIALPIGISFFTFQAMSYIIDVYRGKGQAQKSFLNVCLYISFFRSLYQALLVFFVRYAYYRCLRRKYFFIAKQSFYARWIGSYHYAPEKIAT